MARSVCVFCGASNSISKKYFDMGAELGQKMAKSGIQLVYGGGDCGVMGAVANAVMENDGHVTGVFPLSLKNIENEHQNLTEIIIVDTMHQRKQIMYQRSDIFVVLPGGFGTMDEMFEILTWKQLQLHDKPIIICNFDGYWDHLIALMQNIIASKFASEEVASFFQVVDSIDNLVEAIEVAYND